MVFIDSALNTIMNRFFRSNFIFDFPLMRNIIVFFNLTVKNVITRRPLFACLV